MKLKIINDDNLEIDVIVDKEKGYINFDVKADKDYLENMKKDNKPLTLNINNEILDNKHILLK